jgi:hypothetical protein
VITAKWCRKFKSPVELDPLLVFARKIMLTHNYVGKSAYELLGKNTKYWEVKLKNVDNVAVNNLVDYVESIHNLPLRFEKSYVSIWEYGDGDELPPHVDPSISQSASVVVGLIGKFELYLNDSNTNEVIDTVSYIPPEGIILNNTVCKHSGKCLDNYRLGMLFSVDPTFNIQEWFNG